MKRTSLTSFIVAALVSLSAWWLWAQAPTAAPEKETANSRLVVLWTSGDPEVAHRACLMYVHAAHKQKWFDQVVLIVWGPSARLLTEMLKQGWKVCASSLRPIGFMLQTSQ